ncbi:MAG TPA: molecular chaperone DnaJ [Firmicutes bacterium]|nr:molecular chaperone DnaJ [Bacillota bacterium]
MAKKDYYEILGVNRDAGQDEIKKAYRALARKYHPDMNPGDKEAEERFKEVKEAYDVLGDPEKRARYDQFGHAGEEFGFGGGFSPFSQGFGGFEDIFDFFSGGFSRGPSYGPERGADLRYDLEISLEDAAFGLETVIKVPRTENCPECKGSGARAGTRPETCPQCGGTGQKKIVRNTALGRFINVQTCDACRGEGRIIKEPCRNCGGRGQVQRESKIEIKIPPGVDTGSKLRVHGEGDKGRRNGPPGDLYVYIHVKPHKFFKREGDDIIFEQPISFVMASLGGEIMVPTIDGKKVKMKIPQGTQPGTSFRLRGKGMPRLRGISRGDMHVFVKVQVPEKLNARLRQALKNLAAAMGEEIPEEKGFMDKVKDAFGGGN